MIPLRDENPSQSLPVITVLLILANLSVFIYQHFFIPEHAETLYHRLGFVPYGFFHFLGTDPAGRMPVLLTPVTAMFLHGGWLHLLSNMLYLWIFGDNVEDVLGHGRYLVFYLLSGIAATLIHGFVDMDSQIPMLGASGAIAGVLGAYLFLFPGARIRTLFIIVIIIRIVRIPAILLLGYWIAIQVLSGFSELGGRTGAGIAWFAHIGGFAAGLILILTMNKKRKPRRR